MTDEKSEAFKAGYKNICEIGKERIRRAGAKIKAEDDLWKEVPLNRLPIPEAQAWVPPNLVRVEDLKDGKSPIEYVDESKNPDVGFKVFKLDTSNLVKWDDTPIEGVDTTDLFNRMDGMVESIKKDRTELDVVYEVMLKLGIPLTYKVFENEVNGRKVYSIGDDGLILVCLDGSNGGITPEDISAMCDLTPAKIVAAEEAFKDDVALSNAYYISKDKGVEIELL